MEDLYKDDTNSWLRRAYFSKTVYHRPIPSQVPIISFTELELGPSTMLTLKSNPDATFTGMMQGHSDSKTIKTEPASKKKSISEMLKETAKRRFVGQTTRERTGTKKVMSSSRPKKESCWRLQKYFDHGVRQVSALEKSSEVY
jgi:hypothetical protein